MSMDQRHFHRRLHEATRRLIPSRSSIVCAVSGGVDSVALLHGLLRVNEIHARGWRLRVAHLDHGLRQESAEDARFVESLCRQLGISCTIDTADVRAQAAATRESIETAARRCRYEFLSRVAGEADARVVAVAHHADDQAETILHRILRGTGLRGLAGMPQDRPIHAGGSVRLVRPLLGFRQAELREYVQRLGQTWRHDVTNDAPASATRNRIRHELLPMIEQSVNPQAAEALVQLGEQARRVSEVLRACAEESLLKVSESTGHRQWSMRSRALAMLPSAIQAECVMIVLERLGVGLGEIGSERIEAILALTEGRGDRRHVELAGGVRVERRGDVLMFDASQMRIAVPEDQVESAHS